MDGDTGCCPEAEHFKAQAAACEVEALDPTLQSCCQRDLEQQAAVARLKAQLSLHDRSKERQRAASAVIRSELPPPAPTQPQGSGSGSDLDDDDEELVGT